jgi:RHS repeat-associated protein
VAGTGAWSSHNFYQADAGGNVTAMANNHATVAALVAQYRYDPFGRIFYQSGSLASANTYRFSSKEWFQSPGLYYYGFRFYDPLTQRWLNRDPIMEYGGINLYAFVANGPLNLLDAWGLDCFSDCINNRLDDTQSFCRALAVAGLGALGNLPYKGRPIASQLARLAFQQSMRGVPLTIPEYVAGRAAIAANAAVAAEAAAVGASFLVGYGVGTVLYCESLCYGGPSTGRPVIYRNAPPSNISMPSTHGL